MAAIPRNLVFATSRRFLALILQHLPAPPMGNQLLSSGPFAWMAGCSKFMDKNSSRQVATNLTR
jgi:hypothetical protein